MLSTQEQSEISKFMSYVLRHHPEDIGLSLDKNGWVSINQFIKQAVVQHSLTREMIDCVVLNSKKQRFAISEDGLMIRANQGHTIEIDLGIGYVKPPKELYHGTAMKYMESINKEGLKAMHRHDVHLSVNELIAKEVGERHGKVVILKIDTEKMFNDGFQFQCTKNNVWLQVCSCKIYIHIKQRLKFIYLFLCFFFF